MPGLSEKTCYVIMPFSDCGGWSKNRWNQFYEFELRPAIESEGYACERSDATRGNIVKQIVLNLDSSYVVLADLTGLNYNVLYELGIRHSLSKRTLMITQDNPDFLPFDLKTYGCQQYSMADPIGQSAFKQTIHQLFEHIAQHPDDDDSPVADFVNMRAQWDYERRFENLRNRLTAFAFELGAIATNLERFPYPDLSVLATTSPALTAFLADWNAPNERFLMKIHQLHLLLVWYMTPSAAGEQEQAHTKQMSQALVESLKGDVKAMLDAMEHGDDPSSVPLERHEEVIAAVVDVDDLEARGFGVTRFGGPKSL